jgi:predicted enzyme related to lactoylglutathione lyase
LIETQRFGGDAYGEEFGMAVHYLEIVTDDVDTLVGLYQHVHGLSFGPPDPDLGQARVATQSDGTVVGIRKPLAAHEQPIMRTYLEVKDIHRQRRKPRSPARQLPILQPGRATTAPLQS